MIWFQVGKLSLARGVRFTFLLAQEEGFVLEFCKAMNVYFLIMPQKFFGQRKMFYNKYENNLSRDTFHKHLKTRLFVVLSTHNRVFLFYQIDIKSSTTSSK